MKNIYRQIMHHKKELTKLECIAADYFMESNKPMPLRELADILHLSPATISRFVRKIKFDDYDQFYEAYCMALTSDVDSIDNIYEQHLDIVKKNHQLFEEVNIDNIVEKIVGRRVLIVAKDDTSFACMDFVNRLKRIYIDAHIATGRQDMILESKFLREGDIVIVVSISGYNESINQFLNDINLENYTVIGISTQHSDMIAKCNHFLRLYLDAESIMSLNHSYSLPLTILFDVIYCKVQDKLDSKSLTNKLLTTNKIIS